MAANSCLIKSTALGLMALFACAIPLQAEGQKPKKVMMITDMEGVSGIFDIDLQCIPYKSPRWEESRKLLTGEVNAGVEGVLQGGATGVTVWDGHDAGRTLSPLDIHPKARLLTGVPVLPASPIDSSYSALIFVGQHARAGAALPQRIIPASARAH